VTRQRERAIHATKTHIHTHTAHIGVSDEIQGKLAGAPFWEKKRRRSTLYQLFGRKESIVGIEENQVRSGRAASGRAATEEP